MKFLPAIFMLFASTLFIGCSSGSVTMPQSDSPVIGHPDSQLPVWVSDINPDGTPAAGTGVMGYYNVHIDPDNLSGEMTSLRLATLEDVLEVVDITGFLQVAPCSDCARITGIEIDGDGHLVVKIGIRHPFDPGDPLKPISGQNRADLHVFNVEGIVISDGTAPVSFNGLSASKGGFDLVNSDGFTGYLDDSIDVFFPTDANIHPFITHFADYTSGNFDAANPTGFASVVDPPPSGNLVMPMGSEEDVRDYVFDFPNGDIDFMFAIGCTYAVSAAGKADRFTPEYRVPQHNKKAASSVKVTIDNNELGAGITTSEAQLTIEVLDINHGVAVGTALNEMRADSSISAIDVEISGVTLTPVSFDVSAPTGDGRDPANPLTFTGTLTNSAGAVEGVYSGLVKVTDSYATGLNESSLLDGNDGIGKVGPTDNPLTGVFAISEFATYQAFNIIVESGNESPVCVLEPDPAQGCEGAGVWFNGSNSTDPDGTIETYEFDFDLLDGNPDNFTADVTGVDAVVQSTSYMEGNYVAALRVYDNLGGSCIDTVDVTIESSGVFDVSPYSKVVIADTSFANTVFTPNGFFPDQWQNNQYGMEAMATGSQYIYAIFYASGSGGTGVYLARSADNGDNWSSPAFVRAVSGTYNGASICAVGAEVYIAIIEESPNALTLCYNDNHGDGAFTENQISTSIYECTVSVAVDPINTDNVYIGAANFAFGTHFSTFHIWNSNAGASGTFTDHTYDTQISPPPYNTPSQAYSAELKVDSNQYVYMFVTENYRIEIYKSTDFGVTFTQSYALPFDSYPWGRDSDVCFDPADPDTIYWVTTYRNPSGYRHLMRRSTGGGNSFAIVHHDVAGSQTGYTNISAICDLTGNLYLAYTMVGADVYGKFSSDGGNTLGPAIQVSTDPGNDGHVEIISTTDGCNVVLGWLENRDGAPQVVSRRG